jgi:hypothetical protein
MVFSSKLGLNFLYPLIYVPLGVFAIRVIQKAYSPLG